MSNVSLFMECGCIYTLICTILELTNFKIHYNTCTKKRILWAHKFSILVRISSFYNTTIEPKYFIRLMKSGGK